MNTQLTPDQITDLSAKILAAEAATPEEAFTAIVGESKEASRRDFTRLWYHVKSNVPKKKEEPKAAPSAATPAAPAPVPTPSKTKPPKPTAN